MLDPTQPFARRVAALPKLGLGLSTEFGARHGGVDVLRLRRAHPEWLAFLEIGCDLERGFDRDAREWIAQGWPCTYHFLDVNLEERDSLSDPWIEHTRAQANAARAAWLCGDAGLWHIGPRDRGHGTLMPPVLCAESARAMAENVRALRERSGFEVLPENPPAHVYLGDLHLLEYFARVSEAADCGLLLDVAHLAIYQHSCDHRWDDGLDVLPWERVVEIHVAGGTPFEHRGRRFIDDDHSPEPLPECWRLLDVALARASNLRAIVYEAERNAQPTVLAGLKRIAERWAASPPPSAPAGEPRSPTPIRTAALRPRALQRALFRMQIDPGFARELGKPGAGDGLATAERALLEALDPRAVEADRGGVRREQFLRNVAGEFTHTLVLLGPEALERFPSSPEFHDAVQKERPLPLALADFLARDPRAAELPVRALLTLERALAEARRGPVPGGTRPRGRVTLAPAARLLQLPAGTHATATAIGTALRAGDAPHPGAGSIQPDGEETLLVHARPAASPFAPRELSVEPLPPLVTALLEHCRTPRSHADLLEYARRAGIDSRDLEAVVTSFRDDGVLDGSLEHPPA